MERASSWTLLDQAVVGFGNFLSTCCSRARSAEVDNIPLPACLSFLCWQAQETSRRFLLADFRHRAAVTGDGIAYVGQALLIALPS